MTMNLSCKACGFHKDMVYIKQRIQYRLRKIFNIGGSTATPSEETERTGGSTDLERGVWGCAAVMTPFFQASRRSLAYNLPSLRRSCALHFQILPKKIPFSALFWSKFQLSRSKFSKFSFPRPLIFQGKSSP